MIKWLFCILTILYSMQTTAQNNMTLLNNGSFECVTECPKRTGAIESASGWYLLLESPDLFSSCEKNHILGVPKNYMGYKDAQDGISYAGIALYVQQRPLLHDKHFEYLRREEIRTPLEVAVKAGKSYEFALWYALADSSSYYSTHITLTLSHSGTDGSKQQSLFQTVSIELPSPRTLEWTLAKVRFVSKKNWKSVVVGYARNSTGLTFKEYKRCLYKNKTGVYTKGALSCYYYIDNLSLTEVQ